MHMNKKEYIEYAGNRAKKSNSVVNCIKAFIFGGFICCLGQGFRDLYVFLGEEELVASTLSSVTLIFLAGLFTGIGWFDKIAKHAGAGTLVPITGFVIAGPVIVYGTVASIIYGIIYFFIYRSGGI